MTDHTKFVTLRDVAEAATLDNHERLANDMFAWLQLVVAMKTVNPDAVCDQMHWKDDGKHICTGAFFHSGDQEKKEE